MLKLAHQICFSGVLVATSQWKSAGACVDLAVDLILTICLHCGFNLTKIYVLELFSVPWSSSFTWIFVFSSAKHTQFTRKNHCGVQNFSQLWLVAACKLHFVQFLFHILFSCSSFRVFYVLFISFSHIFFSRFQRTSISFSAHFHCWYSWKNVAIFIAFR